MEIIDELFMCDHGDCGLLMSAAKVVQVNHYVPGIFVTLRQVQDKSILFSHSITES